MWGEFVQLEACSCRERTDVRGVEVGDDQGAIVADDGFAAFGADQRRQCVGVGRPDEYGTFCRRLDELLDGARGDQPTAPDDDEIRRRRLHLAHQMTGNENRPALAGEMGDELADPHDPVRVETVHGLVEDQHTRVAEQRCRQSETLPHTEREPAGPVMSDGGEADQFDDLVDAPAGQALCLGEVAQVVYADRPGCVEPASSNAPTVRSGSFNAEYGRPPIVAPP